jgi:hypothetical protein
MRHGAFIFDRGHIGPRIGLGHPSFWENSNICMPLGLKGSFQMSSAGGGEGLLLQSCKHVMAWPALELLLAKEPAQRSGLETGVMNAVEWVGLAALAPVAAVRLVSLVTALEILLIGKHESRGKRSKLSKRAARVIATIAPSAQNPLEMGDRLYQLRSECLHDGWTHVDKSDVQAAFFFVDAIITAYLTKEPFCKCQETEQLLVLVEPKSGLSYEI